MTPNTQIITRDCPLCGQASADNPVRPEGSETWPMRQCRRCDFVYLDRAPIYERLVEEFAWEKTSELEEQTRKQRNPLVKTISNQLKQLRRSLFRRNKLSWLIDRHVKSGEVLDIGCAGGGFLAGLPARLIPSGIEVSKKLAEDASKRVEPRGGKIIHDNALDGVRSLPGETFSAVVMSAFLEHEVDPGALLAETRRVLKDDGVVIIKVPNWGSWNRRVRGDKWCGIRLPDHVNYFTPSTLTRLAQASGLRPIKFSLPDRLPTSDNMWMVAGRRA